MSRRTKIISDPEEPYTGIIRTLPYFGAGNTREDQAKRKAHERMMCAFRRMERGEDEMVRIAFSVKPKYTVLHCYILVGGRIWVRANIASWEVGTGEKVESWDNPAHVEPVTHRENMMRGEAPTVLLHRNKVCKRGHPVNLDNAYITPAGKTQCRICNRLRQKGLV